MPVLVPPVDGCRRPGPQGRDARTGPLHGRALHRLRRAVQHRGADVSDGTPPKPRPNWSLILGLLVGVGVALAIFIPAIMTRPTPKPVSPPAATTISTSPVGLP